MLVIGITAAKIIVVILVDMGSRGQVRRMLMLMHLMMLHLMMVRHVLMVWRRPSRSRSR